MKPAKTIEEMRALAETKGGKCLSEVYVNRDTPLDWECAKGHRWSSKPHGLIGRGRWCPHCAGQRLTIADFQRIARERGGKCLSETYENATAPMEFECERGHRFTSTANWVKNNGSWCPTCAGKHVGIEDMRAMAEAKGGKCLSEVYVNQKGDLELECGLGHRWTSSGHQLSKGRWCPHCAGKKITIEDFKALARERGGECLSEKYENAHAYLRFRCAAGHEFNLRGANARNQGQWCALCRSSHAARGESLLRQAVGSVEGVSFQKMRPDWLMSERGRKLELDLFDPVAKVAIEYQGVQHYEYKPHFHRKSKDFELQLQRDNEKRSLCAQAGVLLVEVRAVVGPTLEKVAAALKKALDEQCVSLGLGRSNEHTLAF